MSEEMLSTLNSQLFGVWFLIGFSLLLGEDLLGFHDFAGSCAIHMVRGISALIRDCGRFS